MKEPHISFLQRWEKLSQCRPSLMVNVPPTCVITDPSSAYIRQLESKVKLLEGDKLPAQVGWLGADFGCCTQWPA